MALPNFVIIGGMKCGSTALHRYLVRHPEIYVPSGPKNLRFFDGRDNWRCGVGWYESFFAQADGRKVIGEISTEYAKFPHAKDVASNMASILPKAKLIYVVRNPIDRAVSHYMHRVAEGSENRSWERAVTDLDGNPYIDYSRYYFQLQQFLPYYPKERILVLSSEELLRSKDAFMRKIADFVGVDKEASFGGEIRANEGSDRRRWNRVGGILCGSTGARKGFVALKLRFPSIMRIVENCMTSPLRPPRLSSSQRSRLADYFRPDVVALEATFKVDVSHWGI